MLVHISNETQGSVKSIIPFAEVDVALFSVFAAVVIAVIGIMNQWKIARRQLTFEHRSKKESDEDMIEARKEFIRLAKSKTGLVKWADPEHEISDEVRCIRLILNDYEMTAIGCQLKIIDYKFILRFERSTILKYWFYAAPFVYALRSRTNNNSIYHEFEELARSMANNNMPKRSYGNSNIIKWIKDKFVH